MTTDHTDHGNHSDGTGPIGDALRDASLTVDVGDAGDALDQVRATARRRGRRRTALLGLGAVAVLVAGGVVVANVVGDDDEGDDFLVSSPATTEPVDDEATAADTGAATDAPADSAPPETDAVVEEPASEPPPPPAPVPAEDGEWTMFPTEHVVAWNGGFLRFGTRFEPQPLPDELPEEIAELFPQEVLDLFPDGLPDTIDEATTMLREADLLDEVTEVLSEHPEANDAVFAVPSAAPDFVAEFSPVGAEGQWTRVEMTAPLGLNGVEYAVTAGDRLVVAATEYVDGGPTTVPTSNAILLAATTDLVNWTEQRIDVPVDPGWPDYVATEVWLQGFAADDEGWVAGIGRFPQFDVAALVPDPDLADGWIAGGAFGTDAGLEAFYYDPETGEEETVSYTWDELGVEPFVLDHEAGLLASGTWAGGPPRFVDMPVPGRLAAAGGGFLALTDTVRFSPDGVTWTDAGRPGTDPDVAGYPIAVLTVDGGAVVLFGDHEGAITAWRLDTATLTWSDAGFPATSDIAGLSPFGPDAAGPATVLMADDLAGIEPITVAVDDGTYRLEVTSGPRSTTYTLSEFASGEVVAGETASDPWGGDGFDWFTTTTTGDIEASDPATGEVIATFTGEAVNAAFEAAFEEQAPGPPDFQEEAPELWLVATDGADWLVERIDTSSEPAAWWGQVRVATLDGEILVAAYDGQTVRFPF